LDFDYRLPVGVHASLLVRLRGLWRTLAISGAEGIVADGRWRHARIDLLHRLRTIEPMGELRIDGLMIAEPDEADNALGATAWFDDVVIARPGRGRAAVRWKTADVTGIAGYQVALDRAPTTEPAGETISRMAQTWDGLAPGVWWVHVRAVDGAGNWSETAHHALVQQ